MIFLDLIIELLFKNKKVNKEIRYDFFNQHSFTLPNSAKNDVLIGLRQLKRVLQKIWFQKVDYSDQFYDTKSNDFLYVVSPHDISSKLKFIKNDQKVKGALSKFNLLLDLSFSNKILFTIFVILFFSVIVLYVFFIKRNRINIALFPEHILQCYVLIKKLKRFNCKKLYFFYTHEPEANLIAHVLIKYRINVIKIPNTNPLFMFNKHLIASSVLLSLGYQHDEAISYYKENSKLKLGYIIHPELEQYHNNHLNSNRNKNICYYSHASWLRINLDHNLPWFNEIYEEVNLLNQIKQTQLFNNDIITVCLHPKEKSNPQIFSQAKSYYEGVFGKNVIFYEKKSYESFKEYDLGFGAFSSILFERIHCGYKTIIFNEEINGFPIENSDFNKFVIKDIQYLKLKLNKALKMGEREFFNGLNKYTFHFDKLKTIDDD